MREVRAVALSLVVVVGVLAAVAPASTAISAPGAPATGDATGADAEATTAENNSTMGSGVSSFMHSTSGSAGEEVESGMWNEAYENAENRSEKRSVVERRARDIEGRLAELQREKEQLIAARENGTISEAEYEARMSRIVGRMAALNRSIETTERQANETGANTTTVQKLRRSASNLSGPEVAEIARSIPGRDPGELPGQANASRGPPGEEGPPGDGQPGDGSGAPGNDSGPPSEGPPGSDSGPPGNETGPPDNGGGSGGDGAGNGDGEAGNGGSGGDGGPPDDRATEQS